MAQKPTNKPLPPPPLWPSGFVGPNTKDAAGLAEKPLADWVPDNFPNTQQAPSSKNYLLERGMYGRYVPSDSKVEVDPRLSRGAKTVVVGHEAGHSIWYTDLPDLMKEAWQLVHSKYLAKNDPKNTPIFANPFTRYENDPGHSFAASYGEFVANPALFKSAYPEAYRLLREIAGFEYTRNPDKK